MKCKCTKRSNEKTKIKNLELKKVYAFKYKTHLKPMVTKRLNLKRGETTPRKIKPEVEG